MSNRISLLTITFGTVALLTVAGCSSNGTASDSTSIPPMTVSSSSPAATGGTASESASPKTTIPASVNLVDVRTPEEYNTSHLKGAININFDDTAVFNDTIANLPKDQTYFLYCRSGNRSAQAKALMDAAGFTEVIDLGGYEAASATTGIPLVTE